MNKQLEKRISKLEKQYAPPKRGLCFIEKPENETLEEAEGKYGAFLVIDKNETIKDALVRLGKSTNMENYNSPILTIIGVEVKSAEEWGND